LLAELDQNATSQLEEVCWALVLESRIYWGQCRRQSPSLHLSFLQIQNYSFPP